MPNRQQPFEGPASLPVAALAVAWASLLWFHARFFFGLSEAERVCEIPDDGFYYLQTARQFFHLHRWSFDGGISLTSGFHLAWAYLIALISVCVPSTSLLTAVLLVSVLIVHGGAWAAWRRLRGDAWGLLVLAVLVSSVNVAFQSVSLVEWPLVVLAAGVYAALLAKDDGPPSAWALFAAGLGGSLARSDFGLFPAALAWIALVRVRTPGGKARLWASAVGLAGASVGVLAVLAHSWIFTGHWLQGSAQTKLYFAAQGGFNAFMAERILLHLLTGQYFDISLRNPAGLALVIGQAVLLGYAWVRLRPRLAAFGAGFQQLALASALALAAYHVLYCFSGGVQLWYSADQVVPVGILLVAIGRCLPSVGVRRAFAWGLTGLCAINVVALHARRRPLYDGQWSQVEAGRYVKEHAAELDQGRIGAWNAGVLSYYQGGHVVNLDGLVNNDIFPYMRTGRTACYLADQGIVYLVDNDILAGPFTGVMGLNVPCLNSAIKDRRVIGRDREGGRPVLLLELDPARLRDCCDVKAH